MDFVGWSGSGSTWRAKKIAPKPQIVLGYRGTSVCEQLTQGRYVTVERPGVEPVTA